MQTLLNDIELDVQELKCLMQAIANEANPALRVVVKRNIKQMKMRLDALSELLEETVATDKVEAVALCVAKPVAKPIETEQQQPLLQTQPSIPESPLQACEVLESVSIVTLTSSAAISPSILAERIKPSTSLRQGISLNDTFRFTRELFNGDATYMNEVVKQLDEASSLDIAIDVFNSMVQTDEENVAAVDFIELLKKHFS